MRMLGTGTRTRTRTGGVGRRGAPLRDELEREKKMIAVTAALLLFAAEPAWEEIAFEDGIRVWQRKIPDSSLVEFRGQARVPASLRKILAVLQDQKRKTEWMHRCVENRLVHYKALGHMVLYNRTGSNFPLVADRDVVVETSLRYSEAERKVQIEARNVQHANAPEVDGVVRMPKLLLTWDLVALSREETEVTYQVQADPGGLLPSWVVNLVSEKIPFHSIEGLRRQSQKDGYDDSLAVIDLAFDWEKVGMK
jgi:hypothetical protein